MRSEELIEKAKKKAAEREGERVKVRLPNAMWLGIGRCAAACGVSLEEWSLCALSNWEKGRFDGVEYNEKSLLGTRGNSKTGWVRVPEGFGREGLREALAAALKWCEEFTPRVTPQKGTEKWREGRNYRVGKF